MIGAHLISIVLEARELRRSLWPHARETHSCLYEAVCLQMLLASRAGLRTMLQAGSCQWPMRLPSEDDGVMATHFSYVWNMTEARHYILQRKLPELHVWLAYRDDKHPGGVIIDTTSGSWPLRARDAGHVWTALEPPDCLWEDEDGLGALQGERGFGITYECEIDAVVVADGFAQHGIYPVVGKALGI